jgi:hypothetical protein
MGAHSSDAGWARKQKRERVSARACQRASCVRLTRFELRASSLAATSVHRASAPALETGAVVVASPRETLLPRPSLSGSFRRDPMEWVALGPSSLARHRRAKSTSIFILSLTPRSAPGARDSDLESEHAFAGDTRVTHRRSRHRTARAMVRFAIGQQRASQRLPRRRVRRFSRRALARGGGTS